MALPVPVKNRLRVAALILVIAVIIFETVYIVTSLAGPGSGYLAAKGAPINGILCEGMEGQALHIHAQLQLYENGKPIPVPENIGVATGCYYWLHTHTPDGIVHVESSVIKTFTLGMFFDIWGREPFGHGAGFHILIDAQDGKGFQPYAGDYKSLVLRAHLVIAMGTGNFWPRPFTFPEGL